MNHQYPVLRRQDASPRDFIEFWECCYSYDPKDYDDNIGRELTDERIKSLFTWKSPRSGNMIQRYLGGKERIAADVDDTTLRKFLNRPGGSILRIFWLHIQHRKKFPMYDQHAHRAMAFLLRLENLEIPIHNPTKVSKYLEYYRPFVREQFGKFDPRQVDKALWAFGKFLSKKRIVEALRL